MSTGVKLNCDRLEIGYVNCEQELNRLDHYFTGEKRQYRLLGAYVAGNSIYLETDKNPVLYYSYSEQSFLKDDAAEITAYATGNGYLRLPIYLNTPRIYLVSNMALLISGWIILIYLLNPLFRKVNQNNCQDRCRS
ncbi:MAG: hypothetical protein AAFQ14_11070 [Cyanobacteria bacterium J06621_12]